MRQEVHVHGYLELVEGVSRRQVESALQPLLHYLDVEHLKELKSLEPDQPGFVFSDNNWTLEICCTLEVGRNFFGALEQAMLALGRLVENATSIEIIHYHDDGRDESQLMFVGPTPEAILDAQRRHMLEDVSALLARHFRQEAIDEVLNVVDALFRRESQAAKQAPVSEAEPETSASVQIPGVPGRHRLH